VRRTWRVHRWFSPSRESEPRFTKSFRSAFLVPMAALALAVAVVAVAVRAAWHADPKLHVSLRIAHR